MRKRFNQTSLFLASFNSIDLRDYNNDFYVFCSLRSNSTYCYKFVKTQISISMNLLLIKTYIENIFK